jgi:ribosomal protein S12 methylthiotransferase accessory factor
LELDTATEATADAPARFPAAATHAPVYIRGIPLRAAKDFLGGTHRCVPPEVTLERIRPHLATAGITRLADITGLDRIGVSTIVAYRPNGKTLSSAAGKGFSEVAAQVSAAMEGIELHHAENPRLEVRHATYHEMAATENVVAPELLPVAKHSAYSPSRPEHWVRGWDLMGQREVAYPFNSVAMVKHPGQRPIHSVPFVLDSNGLASGNHILEAITAALLEVIERDAVTCHLLAGHRLGYRMPRVELDGLEYPLVLELLERFRRSEVAVLLYDCTLDTAVPVYLAYVYDLQTRGVGLGGGFGAHLDPEVAMIRAMTEAVQSRAVYIAGARDDVFRHDEHYFKNMDSARTIADLLAAPATAHPHAHPSHATDSFEGDIAVLLGKLRAVGIDQALVFDLSHEEVGIPVVRVSVPALEGYTSRLYRAGPRANAFCAALAAGSTSTAGAGA